MNWTNTRSSHPRQSWRVTRRKHVISHIIRGLFNILIMFCRRITFSGAVMTYQKLPAPTYSPSVTDLETIQRIHVMSHAWRESDQALQEATIIHREFMLEQANMNNTSFSRIQNIDRITDMGYSLNRVSPILGEQQTPAQSTKPRNPTSTPRR